MFRSFRFGFFFWIGFGGFVFFCFREFYSSVRGVFVYFDCVYVYGVFDDVVVVV